MDRQQVPQQPQVTDRSGAGSEDASTEVTPIRRRAPRRVTVVVALVSIGLTALVAAAVAVARSDPSERVDVAGPDGSVVADPVDVGTSSDEPTTVVALVMDPATPRVDRLAAIAAGGTSDPDELLDAIDATASRFAIEQRSTRVSTQWQQGDSALVDARVELGANDSGMSGGVLLSSIELERDAGRWLVTSASLCGIAQAAGAFTDAPDCGSATTFASSAGIAGVADLLGGDGEADAPGRPTSLGVWGDPITRAGDVLWFADYPELRLGGGGPSGPAEIVAIDLSDGAVLQRVLLEGTDAQFAVGDGDHVDVLHRVPTGDPMGTWAPVVTRVDARTGRGADISVASDTTSIGAAPDGLWVAAPGSVALHRDDEVRTVEVVPADPYLLSATDDELWVRELSPGGVPTFATVIDARDASTRRVEVPAGALVASGERIWSVGSAVDGGEPSARLLNDDGSIARVVDLPSQLVPPYPDTGATWGDGAGGLWVTGRLRTSMMDPTVTMVVPVTEPAVAFHLGDGPSGDRSTWSSGSSATTATWFRPVGPFLGVGSDGGISFFDD